MRSAASIWFRLTALPATLVILVAMSGCTAARPISSCGRGDEILTAAGTPAQTRAMAVFRSAWLRPCRDRVFSYLPTDPADALARFVDGRIDIAASHSPLNPEEHQRAAQRCDGNPALQLPLVIRGISLPYNLVDVPNLVLTGSLIAKIFTGAVSKWNDPEIVAVNGGAPLPDIPVTPVISDEGSVVTEDLVAYVRSVQPVPGGVVLAAAAPRAVTAAAALDVVAQTPGAITYDATESEVANLPSALIDSGQGPVAFGVEAAMEAVDATEFAEAGNDLTLAIDTLHRTRQPGGYPLVGVSYEVVCSRGYDPATLTNVRSFLDTATTIEPGTMVEAGYVPLPRFLRDRILDVVDSLE